MKDMIDIERKFLVDWEKFKKEKPNEINFISQGYLNTDPNKNVRVRTKGGDGYITVKGIGSDSGMSRFEWEKEIGFDEAKELLDLCDDVLSKYRYEVLIGSHKWEVDLFRDKNAGLILAEIELKSENEEIELPEWILKEVTGDKRYYNSYLSTNPFIDWKHD